MRILAIDPGTTESGWVLYDPATHSVKRKGVAQNADLLAMLEEPWDGSVHLAIEMIASQGMAVGAEVFETVVWIGMFMHAWCWGYFNVLRVTRNQVKLHVCGSAKAKDANVRQAIIDLFPATGGGKRERAVGTAKEPGPLFGMNSHMWPALGVALTAHERLKKNEATRPAGERPAPRRVALR